MTTTLAEMPPAAHRADVVADIAVVGAGPTGLYAAYCAGFRGLRVAVVDALAETGGQITALYPEKVVKDVAGIPAQRGRELVDGLRRQADTFAPVYLLGRQAVQLIRTGDGHQLALADGTAVQARALVITGGIGSFSPRPLPVGEDFLGRGLEYFVPRLDEHAGKDVVIVGGGDSAVDWALALAPVARSVMLVHRRDRFRAHAASVVEAQSAGVVFRTNTQVTAFTGGSWLESVQLTDSDGAVDVVACTSVVAALGFVSQLGPLADWGLDLRGRNIVVDQRQRTNLPGVYAAGDISEYEGKVRLMSVGFGEAATAVNNAAIELDPSLTLFPGHSTEA